MRLLASLAGWFPVALAAVTGSCMAGCGYDFDAAFSGSQPPADASGDPSTDESAPPEDVATDEAAAQDSWETSESEDVNEAQSETEAAAEDVHEEVSHCGNGKQDGDETGIDCGGTCAPCAAEVCTNGIDDDKDGKTDCEDVDCGQYACVNASGVSGWTGPVMVRSGSSCDDGQPPVYSGGWAGLFNEPECAGSTCSCSLPTGQSCSPPMLTTFDDSACTKEIAELKLPSGSCVTMMGAVDGVIVTPGMPINGGCAASGIPGTPGQASWQVPVAVCGVGAGCPSGGACTTNPASWGNDRFLCLVREGVHDCPSGWNVQGEGKGLATKLPENLTCSPCTCGAPSGGTCIGQDVRTYGSQGCMGSPIPHPADGKCMVNSDSAAMWEGMTGFPQGSSCAPATPKVQGPLEASGFVTVCCSNDVP